MFYISFCRNILFASLNSHRPGIISQVRISKDLRNISIIEHLQTLTLLDHYLVAKHSAAREEKNQSYLPKIWTDDQKKKSFVIRLLGKIVD